MKTIILWTGLALIMLVLCTCRSSKISRRQVSELSLKAQTEINTQEQGDKNYQRTASLLDSASQYYQLSIFPLDSFQFSLQEGFKGRASRILISGLNEQFIRLADTTNYREAMSSGSSAKISADLRAGSREKAVEAARQTPGWTGLIVGLLVILIALGLGWKKLKG
jgi:hypothetical protein